MELREAIQAFAGKKILIIGDVMIDRYIHGVVERISPEAPVPVVHYRSEENRPGGAANVALNVQAMGADVRLCSVQGSGPYSQELETVLEAVGLDNRWLIPEQGRVTTVKTRVLAGNHQLLRIDREETHPISADTEARLLALLQDLLADWRPDAVILQDYNKGMLTPGLVGAVLDNCRTAGIPVAVDPKKDNFFAYRGASLFKPNLKELSQALGISVGRTLGEVRRAVDLLDARIAADRYLITLSEAGIYYRDRSGDGLCPVHRVVNVADVSGAGDTVIAVAALGIASGADLRELAAWCNMAAAQVCEAPGVVPVDLAGLF